MTSRRFGIMTTTAFLLATHLALSPPGVTEPQPVLYILDGVGGFNRLEKALTEALPAGNDLEIREVQWSHGFGRWHADLTDRDHIERQADALAESIIGYRTLYPGSPVYLVARSGGTAVAARALEQLPENSVERAVFLASGLSPEYDLVPAMSAIRSDLTAFHSHRDRLILSLGTRVFGTADGVRGPAAGLRGFETAEEDSKLRQISWSWRMIQTGHWGGHLGSGRPDFLRQFVVPLLMEVPPKEAGKR
jgi:pimeloyl-ACP methyl ester carboxylesterase